MVLRREEELRTILMIPLMTTASSGGTNWTLGAPLKSPALPLMLLPNFPKPLATAPPPMPMLLDRSTSATAALWVLLLRKRTPPLIGRAQ